MSNEPKDLTNTPEMRPPKLSPQAATDLREALDAWSTQDDNPAPLVCAALACAAALEDAVRANDVLRTTSRICDDSSIERWKAMVRVVSEREGIEVGLLEVVVMPNSNYAFVVASGRDDIELSEHLGRLVNENPTVNGTMSYLRSVGWALNNTLRPVDVALIHNKAKAHFQAMAKWINTGRNSDTPAPVDTAPKALTTEETAAALSAIEAAGLGHLRWVVSFGVGLMATLGDGIDILCREGMFMFSETALHHQKPEKAEPADVDFLRWKLDDDIKALKAARKAMGPAQKQRPASFKPPKPT